MCGGPRRYRERHVFAQQRVIHAVLRIRPVMRPPLCASRRHALRILCVAWCPSREMRQAGVAPKKAKSRDLEAVQKQASSMAAKGDELIDKATAKEIDRTSSASPPCRFRPRPASSTAILFNRAMRGDPKNRGGWWRFNTKIERIVQVEQYSFDGACSAVDDPRVSDDAAERGGSKAYTRNGRLSAGARATSGFAEGRVSYAGKACLLASSIRPVPVGSGQSCSILRDAWRFGPDVRMDRAGKL